MYMLHFKYLQINYLGFTGLRVHANIIIIGDRHVFSETHEIDIPGRRSSCLVGHRHAGEAVETYLRRVDRREDVSSTTYPFHIYSNTLYVSLVFKMEKSKVCWSPMEKCKVCWSPMG